MFWFVSGSARIGQELLEVVPTDGAEVLLKLASAGGFEVVTYGAVVLVKLADADGFEDIVKLAFGTVVK